MLKWEQTEDGLRAEILTDGNVYRYTIKDNVLREEVRKPKGRVWRGTGNILESPKSLLGAKRVASKWAKSRV